MKEEMNTVPFPEFGGLKHHFGEIRSALEGCKMKPFKLPYEKRIELLRRVENAYRGLYSFAEEMRREANKHSFDKKHLRYFERALATHNIIQAKAGPRGEYMIYAPPLGDRFNGNADFIAYYTHRALDAAIKDGAKFRRITDGCIIVKQFCRCQNVAMGTLENREIHSITDTIIKRMAMDDSGYYYDVCYVWAESDDPRTEIIIVDKEDVETYQDYVHMLIEPIAVGRKLYNNNYLKRDCIVRSLNQIEEVLNTHKKICVENGMLTHDLCMDLTALLRALDNLQCALRAPYISDERHKFSEQYSKKSKKREHILTDEEVFNAENEYYYKLSTMCSTAPEKVSIKTKTPFSFLTERGRDLCEEQRRLLLDSLPYKGPLTEKGSDDLAVTIDRYMPCDYHNSPDSDNLNTHFLIDIKRRVKIIYVKSIHAMPPDDYDCIITLTPAALAYF